MNYLKLFENFEPQQDQVKYWLNYLDKNYPITDYHNMKMIDISGKGRYISGPLMVKSTLKQQIFNDIVSDNKENIHEPSLRRAISTWIDQQSPVKENLNNEFDLEFALAKIKEHFNFDKVKEMLDKEVLEWTPEEEDGSYYTEHSNGEAEDAIITHLIDWYSSKYPSGYSDENEDILREAIQKEYNFLSY